MTERSCYWSITINNPTAEDEAEIELLKTNRLVKEFKYQLEEGSEGTKHYQGCLHTASLKFSAVKKMLKRAHIEKATNPFALQNYVGKEDTRLESRETIRPFTPGLFYAELIRCPRNTDEENLAWCDRVARTLIERGTQGVEYWISNPMVRTALKNFLSSIIIRENALLPPQEDDRSPQEEGNGDDTQA